MGDEGETPVEAEAPAPEPSAPEPAAAAEPAPAAEEAAPAPAAEKAPAKEQTLAVAPRAEASRQEIHAASSSNKVMESPRTREACRRLGLHPEDLHPRPLESFAQPGEVAGKEKQQLRFQHYEKKRKDYLAQVLAEKAKVQEAQQSRGEMPGAQSAQFLGMLENLFEKEAKRLETDLKSQLRQHNSLVRENEEQLRKESILQEKMIDREKRTERVNKQFQEVGMRTKEKTEAKLNISKERMAKQQEEQLAKQMSFAKEVLAEQERLDQFIENRKVMASEKNSVFRERVEKMRSQSAQRILDRQAEGEIKLMEIQAKVETVAKRRDEEQSKRMLRSEEQHLHIMDVRETKERLERVESHRRGELKEQISSNVERIETLLALKDQLLVQRRGRNLKAEASRGSRGLNLKKHCTPGPGQYEAPKSCLEEAVAPSIGKSKVPGMLDDAVKGTAKNPAPGTYDTTMLPNGKNMRSERAVKFNSIEKKTFLDDAMAAKADMPAPGRYEVKNTLDERAVKLARARIGVADSVDKNDPRRYPEWARPGTNTPGPAGYNVDEYLRKDVLRRAQASLPNLTRDILRPGTIKE